MDTFTHVSYQHARSLTLHYSSSFGLSSRLFTARIRLHIYAVYGLVRIADEIVDTYRGNNQKQLLDELEAETYAAIKRQYSPHPIVHAFALTAQKYGINSELIAPFFKSMRMDLEHRDYTPAMYDEYIHGSAEVIGLMCLRVFCEGNDTLYAQLETGARSLGAAYQKVNFLRDMAADYRQLGRVYFPSVDAEHFSAREKRHIIEDSKADFAAAKTALDHLPRGAKTAVMTSYEYYNELLQLLEAASPNEIMEHRISVPSWRKLWIMIRTIAMTWRPW